MIQIIRREKDVDRCLPCGILFRLDEEPKVKRHCEEDHKIPYIRDDFKDVYDSREVVTPELLRAGGAL